MVNHQIGAGLGEREAQRLTANEMEQNLPPGITGHRWKTILTCAKNWHTYMEGFGGIVGAFFFPENEVAGDVALGSQWTHSAFGTHVTKAEMNIILELSRMMFSNIQQRFRHTPLDQLANDIRNRRVRPEFTRMGWEAGPKGIQHGMRLRQDHPIINWKLSANPEDWARAQDWVEAQNIQEIEMGEAENE